MAKKGKLYLLVLVNLFAWGYVGYKVYSALQGTDDLDLQSSKVTFNKIQAIDKKDSIKLNLNYNDPFLKGGSFSKEHSNYRSSSNQPTTQNPVIKANTSVSIQKPVVTPTINPTMDIKYLGLVTNQDKGTKTALLLINGKTAIVKVNDVVDGIKFIQITNEVVVAQKGKEKFIVKK